MGLRRRYTESLQGFLPEFRQGKPDSEMVNAAIEGRDAVVRDVDFSPNLNLARKVHGSLMMKPTQFATSSSMKTPLRSSAQQVKNWLRWWTKPIA